MKDVKKAEDICAHLGDDYDRYLGAIIPPLFQNSLFTRKNVNHGYVYSRIENPTVEIAEKKIAAMENAQAAKMFASGMAAISACISSLVKQDDHIVILRTAYFPVHCFLKEELAKYGVTYDIAEDFSIQEMERLTKENTKLFYIESPSSNVFKILNIPAIVSFAKQKGIKIVIDNTWATPLYQNPLDMGVDYVVHSATKYLNGHSDVIAGFIVGDEEHLTKIKNNQRANWGACADPFAAWLLTRGLRTLPVRMEKHCESAQKVAEFLENHPKVSRVYYPGLKSHENYDIGVLQHKNNTGLMSFVLNASTEKTMQFLKALNVFEEGPSWGGFESVINTPGITTDEMLVQLGVPKGLVRISVGLEDADTIVADLENALKLV